MRIEKLYPPEVIWIEKNEKLLNIYQIEMTLGMCQKTLSGFIRGDRPLADHWFDKIAAWYKAFVALPAGSGSKKAEVVAPDKKNTSAKKSEGKNPAPKKAVSEAKIPAKSPGVAKKAQVSDYMKKRRGF